MIGRLLRRRSFLSDREQDLRAREQELLERLARALESFGPDVQPADLQRFREATEQLAGLFLLVIAGEFNSGKSSFINALLGERVLPEGVTPTTDRINLLHPGPEITERPLETFLLDGDGLRMAIGVLVSMLQAMTQINESTLTFIPKMVAVLVVLMVMAPWMLQVMEHYTVNVIQSAGDIGK